VFLTSARAVIAALLGVVLLLALRQKRPARSDLARWSSWRWASWSAFRC
jgi:hypothetical protein